MKIDDNFNLKQLNIYDLYQLNFLVVNYKHHTKVTHFII